MPAETATELLGLDLLPDDPADIVYITNYVGKLDSGIAFTDHFYLDGLSRLPLSALVLANKVPTAVPRRLLQYTSSLAEYRRHQPLIQLTNGLGSFFHNVGPAYLPEHADSITYAFVHDEPSAYDHYDTAVWNRENVANSLMPAQDGFIFVSANSQRLWNEYPHIAAKPQYYLPNTCAEESYIAEHTLSRSRDEARAVLGYSPDEVNLAIVATVQPRKGQLTAIDALARIRQLDPTRRYRLRFIGRTTQRDYGRTIAAHVAQHGLDDVVEMLGQADKEDALRHIYASDALLSTSFSEAMPLVLLEAMQLRTPIITTPVGGVTEMLDTASALFVEPGDADALAQAITAVASSPAETAERVRVASERYWSDFSNARFHERFHEILRDIVANAAAKERADAGEHAMIDVPQDAPSRRAQRVALALDGSLSDTAKATVRTTRSDLAGMLTDATPLLRSGFDVADWSTATGTLELARDIDAPPTLSGDDIALLVNAERHASALAGDDPRRSAQRTDAPPSLRFAIARKIAAVDRRLTGATLRRAARQVPGASDVERWIRRPSQKRASPRPTVPATVFVFNSVTQMVSALALWDQKYAAAGGGVLVAAVYSTGGSSGFSRKLARIARKTGRFRRVVDITGTYKRVYSRELRFGQLVRLKREFRQHLRPFSPQTVFIAAFMSARAQKLLYEVFADADLRLFEDGIGSYVPKPIKMSDTGIVDRVIAGDCAEAYHIRRISSVDLLLHGVPAPPQYTGEIDGLRYPELTVGAYRLDYGKIAQTLGVTPRAFPAGSTLVVTQNFFDHLSRRGLTLDAERRINDDAISRLVDAGGHVILRPHPRASADVWSARWERDPRVEVWRDDPAVPVEALIDPTQPPETLVGISSSCLFYLDEQAGMTVRRYPDEALDTLEQYSTTEYRQMLQIARHGLQPLDR